MDVHWELYIRICNLWRLFDDIQDSWGSVSSIIEYWGTTQDILAPIAGPGHWNDPDMIIIGDTSLSVDESKTQFALWSMFAAPLYLSADLRDYPDWAKQIVQNKEIIAVDQDTVYAQGRRIKSAEHLEVWVKQVLDGTVIILFNSNIAHAGYDGTVVMQINWNDLISTRDDGFNHHQIEMKDTKVRDLWEERDIGYFSRTGATTYQHAVQAEDAVMLKFTYPLT